MAKHLIEAVDEEKKMIIFKVVEADFLEQYAEFRFIITITPKGKGSVAHCTLEYEKLHGKVPDSHSMLKLCEEVCRDLDAHLMQSN